MATLQATSITGSFKLPVSNTGCTAATGYMWYNDATLCRLVYSYEPTGVAWSVGGNMITGGDRGGGAGTGVNSGLAMGGIPNQRCTEEYNGTSWASSTALITNRREMRGGGTQNDALAMGGVLFAICSCTEEYNGSTWANGGALITARHYGGGGASSEIGILYGGTTSPSTCTTATEEYNGSSWSSGGALISAGLCTIGGGIQNSALAMYEANLTSQEYNGTSWSTGGNMIYQHCGGASSGNSSNSHFVHGGQAPFPFVQFNPTYECYNGTTWSAQNFSNRSFFRHSSTQSSFNDALVFQGGDTDTWTEEVVTATGICCCIIP